MKSKLPLNTIVIPVYNGGNYLKDAIHSALNQTYPNIEVLVVDDGSQDRLTKKTVELFEGKVRFIQKKNGGTGSALNLGFREASGEYLHWLSHDDVYFPRKVSSDMHLILNSSKPKDTITISGWHFMNQDRELISTRNIAQDFSRLGGKFYPWLILKGMANGCTICIPKSKFISVGNFREDLKTTQDYEYWARLFPKSKIIVNEEIHVANRIHENQGSHTIANHHIEADDMYLQTLKEFEPAIQKSKALLPAQSLLVVAKHLEPSIYYNSKAYVSRLLVQEYIKYSNRSSRISNPLTFEAYIQSLHTSILERM
ncbi:WcaA Glycosyltransferases involved in cell wall biogenesis [Candidatus Nanopelagicaceae bacterium]